MGLVSMIRNLIASAILMSASTFALASNIADSLNAENAVSADIIGSALAGCTDTACTEDVIAESIKAGIDAASVMSIALTAGIDAKTIASALRTANVSESDIVAAAIVNNQNPENFTDATATGNTPARVGSSTRNQLPAAGVPNGISPAVGDQRTPVTDFDIPGISIGNDNSIQFD
jgi:hypothetical protein